MKLIVGAGNVYTEKGVLKNNAIVVENDFIDAFTPLEMLQMESDAEVLVYPENYHILPGFIDLHIHGASGFDVMDKSFAALEGISQTLAKEGTTGYLATTMTAKPRVIEQVLKNVREYMEMQDQLSGAAILGVHLEGPFLSPRKVGAQRSDEILNPQIDYIQQWIKISGENIRLVTLAPELAGSIPFIEYLVSQNIVASMGHTNASYEEGEQAIKAGCSHVTHLFNAMRGLHHREPGAILSSLLSDKVTAELILDGIHLHPAIVEMSLRLKGKDKIVFVTDAMRAQCMVDGEYELGGQLVTVSKSRAQLKDGTLAGSTLTMSQALRNFLEFTQYDVMDVVKFTSENPAKILNIFDRKGSLAVQKDADFVVLDEKYQVVLTVRQGEIVFGCPSQAKVGNPQYRFPPSSTDIHKT